NYQTDAVIYKAKDKEVVGEEEELEKVKEGSLQMNKPMKFGGYTLYQSGYQENEFSDMTFGIYETDDEDGDSLGEVTIDRKSTRLNSSHVSISYAVFCLKKKKQ